MDAWRKHFVLEENMLEVDCSVITPEPVSKTSGHVERFSGSMCKDPAKGEHIRADHLVELVLEGRLASGLQGQTTVVPKLDAATRVEYTEILAKIDDYDGEELGAMIK